RRARHHADGVRSARPRLCRRLRLTVLRMAPSGDKLRLDEMLVQRGLFPSRSRARDAIARGAVLVEGRPATKAGQAASMDALVTVDDPATGYVSRAALKLLAGLDAFGFDPAGATV